MLDVEAYQAGEREAELTLEAEIARMSPEELTRALKLANSILLERAPDDLLAYMQCVMPWYRPAKVHREIANGLMAVDRGVIDRLMITTPPRTGKALAPETPIPTPTGWRPMGDLKPGDSVFGADGSVISVVERVEFDSRPIYRVTNTKTGNWIDADAGHEWLLRADRKSPDRLKLHTSRWMARIRNDPRPYMTPVAKALDLPAIDAPIDPYVLGLWLGDGNSYNAVVSVGDEDWEATVEAIRSRGYTVRETPSRHECGIYGIKPQLRELGLLGKGKKRIPRAYLRASKAQRLELLCGLVDSDGYVSPRNGEIEYCTTSPWLAIGVHELIATLGKRSRIHVGRAKFNGKDCGPRYRIRFFMAGAACLPRKVRHTRDTTRHPAHYLSSEYWRKGTTVCIQVSAPDGMFLAGHDMVPTHNSVLVSQGYPAWSMGRNPRREFIGASYGSDLSGSFGGRLRNMMRNPIHEKVFGRDATLSPDSQARDLWQTRGGGVYRAAGVGSGITGFGANVAIIDDPVKSREEADSPTIQKRNYDWYMNDLYSRRMKNSAFIYVATRWSEGDLGGMLLADQANGGDYWTHLHYAALPNPPWPEEYGVDFMERTRSVMLARGDERGWNSLYMGNPTPDEGVYFKREWLKTYERSWLPRIEQMKIYGASDYALAHGRGDYTVHVVVGVDPNDRIFVLDMWREQAASNVWVEALIGLMKKYRPVMWAEEAGQILKGVGPFITRRMMEEKVYTPRTQYSSAADKPSRARAIQGRMAMGLVYWPVDAPWWDAVKAEFLRFPAGTHDDAVDVLSLIGRMLGFLETGRELDGSEIADMGLMVSTGGRKPKGFRRPLMGEISGIFSNAMTKLSDDAIAIRTAALDRIEREHRKRGRFA